MRAIPIVARLALQESLRRRVFLVVLLLTVIFLGLFTLGSLEVYDEVDQVGESLGSLDPRELATAYLLGLGMFATLFLGVVLAVFLTLGAVRGDAERGLLQPLVVRPLGRTAFLLGRFLAAAGVCGAYVAAVFSAIVLIAHAAGGGWPDRVIAPCLALVLAVAIVVALSLLGSVVLSATANGIAVFMLFGAGLVGGILGQIGDALASQTLRDVADVVSNALPFEALYQAGLHELTANATGVTGAVLQLGPFGGSKAGGKLLVPWAVAYLLALGAAAALAFRRRDL